MSQRSTISPGAAEVPSNVRWHPKTLIGTVNLLSKNANASLITKIALLCASRGHARVVHFKDMWQWPHVVDVDDSEAAVLPTNLVSQFGDKRPSIGVDAIEMDRCRILRLQQQEWTEISMPDALE